MAAKTMMTRREGGCSLEQKETEMLGNGTQGDSGQIEALGGDAIDRLLDRIKGDGGNGAGDGNGGDEGGGGGSDPYDAPATIRMLLDTARQVATFVTTCAEMATERQAKFTVETIVKGRETGQDQMLEIARQLHDNAMRISDAVATRLETIEERLLAIEKHLGGKPVPRASGGRGRRPVNDEPRRVIVGSFSGGLSHVTLSREILEAAEAKLTEAAAERAERERAERATIRVDKAWLLGVLRDLIARIEHDHTLAVRVGDYGARCNAARKVNRLREDAAAVMQHREPPP